MKLTTMQDIAGCRAVMRNKADVSGLIWNYLHSNQRHIIANQKDYINYPKNSGYRSVHLVYRFDGKKRKEHNGRMVEVQIRSKLQHAWATAVETVGTFLAESLKSSQGPEKWLRFFALASSAFALDEKSPTVPHTPSNTTELFEEINYLANLLELKNKLSIYGNTLKISEHPDMKRAHYFLMTLRPAEAILQVRAYSKEQLDEATENYLNQEKIVAGSPGGEAVLVSVDSLDALRKAYPNYYLDTQVFVAELKRITSKFGLAFF